jgi:drug/metabolite transporter (DMT)-like permease
VLSALLAVLAAVANANASVLQRKGARRERDGDGPSVRILVDLARQPVWLGGIGSVLLGFVLQAIALATGPIALVQPILVIELAFTLLLSSAVFHTRLSRREWTAVAGMSVGLALLLVALSPAARSAHHAATASWIVGTTLTAVVIVALTVAAYRGSAGVRRAALLGVATGVAFGFTAVLVAAVTASFGRGVGGVLTVWQTYGVLVLGPAGFLLLQNALRAGRLVASQPGMTLTNPLVAVGWGVTGFGEHVRTGGWLVLAVFAAALIGVSTVLLAHSPALRDRE